VKVFLSNFELLRVLLKDFIPAVTDLVDQSNCNNREIVRKCLTLQGNR
jgi:hypothetical protein